jgi:hypothetical protein
LNLLRAKRRLLEKRHRKPPIHRSTRPICYSLWKFQNGNVG